MQRVLVVAFSVVPSPDRHSVQLVSHLKALAPRYSVDVVTVKSPDLPYVERFMKTRMLRVPCGSGPFLEQVETFRRAVRRQLEGAEYEIVHFRCPWGGLPICEKKAEGSGRLLFEVTRSMFAGPLSSDAAVVDALRRDEDLCLERADRIVVPTAAGAAYLEARGLGAKTSVVPPGVDIDLFDWESSPEADPPRILFAGRVGPGRGVRLLLEAVREVLKSVRVELCLAGPVDPGFEQPLTEAIARLGLEKHVVRLGPFEHADLPRVIATATVCVAPHAADPRERPLAAFPFKVLEYMACRRAVVAPRRPAVAEIVRDGDEGLLFEPGDANDLAAGIVRLLEDPGLRARIADAGYRAVREHRPASASRRALLDVYGRLVPAEPIGPSPASVGPSTEAPASMETTTARRSILRARGTELALPEFEETDQTMADATRPDIAFGADEGGEPGADAAREAQPEGDGRGPAGVRDTGEAGPPPRPVTE